MTFGTTASFGNCCEMISLVRSVVKSEREGRDETIVEAPAVANANRNFTAFGLG